MSYEVIPLDVFSENYKMYTELSSVALGGRVVSVSDDFFAEAFHLLLVEPAPSLKGQFGPKGALYSGWESRRHNPTYDWCIIRLGISGTIKGFDIDTSHFSGNEAPHASVDVLYSADACDPQADAQRWQEVLPKVSLGPNLRHLFKIPATTCVNYVKLNMYPDGGIARFRVYGDVVPVYPTDLSVPFDLAHVFAGGKVVFTSDQHFGVGSNLILPGRGKDMGDGWETKRSRQKGHQDWAIVQLGTSGYLEHVEIDTAHFKGNFPESCELHAVCVTNDKSWDKFGEAEWSLILPRAKLGPHRQHFFQLENVEGQLFTHVRLTIHPDGGIKRIRVIGRRAADSSASQTRSTVHATVESTVESVQKELGDESTTMIVPVLPLSPEVFVPFGQVIRAYNDVDAAPRGTRITPANQGTATKFHKLAPIVSSYPLEMGATTGVSVYRCKPLESVGSDGLVDLSVLERHRYTNQGFIPMGAGDGERAYQGAYLVVVARNGENDRPDLGSLRAFVASARQGIMYATGVWHQPMTVLDRVLDLACVETQVGDGSLADCEIVEVKTLGHAIKLQLPRK